MTLSYFLSSSKIFHSVVIIDFHSLSYLVSKYYRSERHFMPPSLFFHPHRFLCSQDSLSSSWFFVSNHLPSRTKMMLLFLVPRYLHRLLPLLLPFISFSTDYSATGFQPVGHISLANRHIATSAASQNQFPEVGGCFGRGLNSRPTALYENKSQDGKRGYQFGDITKAVTKSLIGKRVSKVCFILKLCLLFATESEGRTCEEASIM